MARRRKDRGGKRGKPWKREAAAKDADASDEASGGLPPGDPLLHAWPDARLDLHGRTVVEAETATRNFVLTQARLGEGRIVHVITGKGTGALFLAVGRFLRGDLDRWVDDVRPDLGGAGWRVRVKRGG